MVSVPLYINFLVCQALSGVRVQLVPILVVPSLEWVRSSGVLPDPARPPLRLLGQLTEVWRESPEGAALLEYENERIIAREVRMGREKGDGHLYYWRLRRDRSENKGACPPFYLRMQSR